MQTVDHASEWAPSLLPDGMTVREAEPLTGGMANAAWRVLLADGRTVVVKGGRSNPDGFFDHEVESLRALRDLGGLPTPEIFHVGPKSLVMAALNPAIPDTPRFWEAAAQSIAALHEHTGPRYGWHRDGTLGRLVQENAWDDDGFRFFAERRVLRYLREPKVEAILDAAERAALERVCARLPELLPPAPPTLTHGDLWRANIIAGADGRPVFIDPSVSYTWPEVDISMLYCTGGVPDAFFAAYYELRPSAGDWRERMDLLYLRELLCIVAHFGTRFPDVVPKIRQIVTRFS